MSSKITRSWWPDLLAVAAFVALTLALARGHLLALDEWVADWSFAHQPWVPYWTARVLNYLGQGAQVLMPVAVILTFLWWRRIQSIRAVLPFVAAFVLTFFTIGPAKVFFDRAAPKFKLDNRAVLFNPDASGTLSVSYPSGHVANALVWYAVIAVLLAGVLQRALTRRETILVRVLPVAIVFITTVYTGFHWLTDSIAALFLGLVLARLIDRTPWDRIPLGPLERFAGSEDRSPGQVGGEHH
ncbi:phosphatase PAP2 family protein [Actinoplanes sichuanensis]|uniref:Phosphatase PAP2 family protein n=1 Tax=Actinoplanes sichuanensis TaxID=512349 RepID=A0ABW4AKH2_9ACTN|nr:phosphatase PAP2 family protein [Actinoplanes sichuanensis]BEL11056.1 phosphatase PAP2 family protein [Actinoplanes sichuanensis]